MKDVISREDMMRALGDQVEEVKARAEEKPRLSLEGIAETVTHNANGT